MAALTNRYEDDDARHLPPGMKRVGYDTDTERYTFRHEDDLWLGEPGSLYGGKMKWAGKAEENSSEKMFSKDEFDNESAEDDDYDSDDYSYTEEKKLKTSYAKHRKSPMKPLPYAPTSSNDWGVPVTSISSTDARPPDSAPVRTKSLFKKAATSTVTAIGVTRQWSTRRKGKTTSQRDDDEKTEKGERSRESGGHAVYHQMTL